MALLQSWLFTHCCLKIFIKFQGKTPQEAKDFSFKLFRIMRFLRSLKCLKTTVELTFTKQKENACSPTTACSVFQWKYPFWVNLVLRLIRICRIPW